MASFMTLCLLVCVIIAHAEEGQESRECDANGKECTPTAGKKESPYGLESNDHVLTETEREAQASKDRRPKQRPPFSYSKIFALVGIIVLVFVWNIYKVSFKVPPFSSPYDLSLLLLSCFASNPSIATLDRF